MVCMFAVAGRRGAGLWPAVALLGLASLVVAGVAAPLPGVTRLTLADGASGRTLYDGVLADGRPLALTWRNSLFGLDVTEVFVARGGLLVQTAVTFADPAGGAPPPVSPAQVDDLYQTGGPFSATGMERPFRHIVYRISEIGNPKLQIGPRLIAFKAEVGFGGSVILDARPAATLQTLHAWIKGDWP